MRGDRGFSVWVVVSDNSGGAETDLWDGDDQLGRAFGVLAVAVGRVVDPVTFYKDPH